MTHGMWLASLKGMLCGWGVALLAAAVFWLQRKILGWVIARAVEKGFQDAMRDIEAQKQKDPGC